MVVNLGYSGSEIELNVYNESKNKRIYTLSNGYRNVKEYTYEDAINLTGHGRYSIGLLVANCFAILGMNIDMFGFPVVIAGCACEFRLESKQNKILVSIPFMGAIAASYAWGYVSDTQGRRKSLLIGMWGSFLASTMSAFSPNWIVLGVFKFISVSFCSCAQSATYTIIGESCSERVKAPYLFILTGVLNLGLPYDMVMSYFSIQMDFSYDLCFISFTPWRLLVLLLAVPLGISAVSYHYVYESPKFLANMGCESQALDILGKIWRRNHGGKELYPVEKFILQEHGNCRKNISLLQSMWEQTVPLFRMPLLLQTLKLYYLTIVVYGVTNSLLTWFPFLSDTLVNEESSSGGSSSQSLCDMIASSQVFNSTVDDDSCKPKTNLTAVWSALIGGVVFMVANISLYKLAHRRKAVLIAVLAMSSLSSFGTATIPNKIASLTLYFSSCLTILGIGIVCSYFVDLYPTSHRGMVSCLAVLVARAAGLNTTYLVGTYIMSHCTHTFYLMGVHIISAVVVACFLPPDKEIKT